ncbi:MAG TPA: helix-turn-helix transcriptional regulator [Candidatus Glassbacteria bacterium]|jgi:transcriptional regulator with XRE-family HTH domain|nr:helix-turn-helix transcriptional regulator [Candidatus Glassbacteria bacterium]
MNKDLENIVDLIKEERISYGITQLETSKALGLSKSQVSRFEMKKHSPTLNTIMNFANAIGVKITVELKRS